jgi:hypothetical protein
MESTGKANRIQVSQKTADLLTADGKGRWLTPREDRIDAKGKGKMQTYWVERRRGGSQSSGISIYEDTDMSESLAVDDPVAVVEIALEPLQLNEKRGKTFFL